jgi:hypothetical protein
MQFADTARDVAWKTPLEFQCTWSESQLHFSSHVQARITH